MRACLPPITSTFVPIFSGTASFCVTETRSCVLLNSRTMYSKADVSPVACSTEVPISPPTSPPPIAPSVVPRAPLVVDAAAPPTAPPAAPPIAAPAAPSALTPICRTPMISPRSTLLACCTAAVL